MPRQRIFNPNFWKSKNLKKLYRKHGAESVLFYWGLVSNSDDEGRGYCDFDWFEMMMPLLKLDEELVNNWLLTINELVLAVIYRNQNCTKTYFFIPDWFCKQKIPKPYPSEIPLPDVEFFTEFQDYYQSLLAVYEQINQRFAKEERPIPNRLRTSYELIKEQFITGSPMKGKERKEKKKLINKEKIYKKEITEIYEFWKSKDLFKHQNLTPVISNSIEKAIKRHSVALVKEAISNYAIVMHGQDYYIDHRFHIKVFLGERKKSNITMENFFTKNKPFDSFRKKHQPSNIDRTDKSRQNFLEKIKEEENRVTY